jgi:hypothetical protein
MSNKPKRKRRWASTRNHFFSVNRVQSFYNTSPLDMKKIMGDQDYIHENLNNYIQAFSTAVRDIFESFEFHTQIERLNKA